MNKSEANELFDRANEVAKVKITSKPKLYAALPVLGQLQDRVAALKNRIAEYQALISTLTEKSADYVLENPSVADEYRTHNSGSRWGYVTIGDCRYWLNSGAGKIRRKDGKNLDESFLSGLPKGWTKKRTVLYTKGINELGVMEEELSDHGLFRPVDNSWECEKLPESNEE